MTQRHRSNRRMWCPSPQFCSSLLAYTPRTRLFGGVMVLAMITLAILPFSTHHHYSSQKVVNHHELQKAGFIPERIRKSIESREMTNSSIEFDCVDVITGDPASSVSDRRRRRTGRDCSHRIVVVNDGRIHNFKRERPAPEESRVRRRLRQCGQLEEVMWATGNWAPERIDAHGRWASELRCWDGATGLTWPNHVCKGWYWQYDPTAPKSDLAHSLFRRGGITYALPFRHASPLVSLPSPSTLTPVPSKHQHSSSSPATPPPARVDLAQLYREAVEYVRSLHTRACEDDGSTPVLVYRVHLAGWGNELSTVINAFAHATAEGRTLIVAHEDRTTLSSLTKYSQADILLPSSCEKKGGYGGDAKSYDRKTLPSTPAQIPRRFSPLGPLRWYQLLSKILIRPSRRLVASMLRIMIGEAESPPLPDNHHHHHPHHSPASFDEEVLERMVDKIVGPKADASDEEGEYTWWWENVTVAPTDEDEDAQKAEEEEEEDMAIMPHGFPERFIAAIGPHYNTREEHRSYGDGKHRKGALKEHGARIAVHVRLGDACGFGSSCTSKQRPRHCIQEIQPYLDLLIERGITSGSVYVATDSQAIIASVKSLQDEIRHHANHHHPAPSSGISDRVHLSIGDDDDETKTAFLPNDHLADNEDNGTNEEEEEEEEENGSRDKGKGFAPPPPPPSSSSSSSSLLSSQHSAAAYRGFSFRFQSFSRDAYEEDKGDLIEEKESGADTFLEEVALSYDETAYHLFICARTHASLHHRWVQSAVQADWDLCLVIIPCYARTFSSCLFPKRLSKISRPDIHSPKYLLLISRRSPSPPFSCRCDIGLCYFQILVELVFLSTASTLLGSFYRSQK
eukprot:jgi/Bigna1/72074/fgenesh1_pg.18_\